MTMSDMSFPTTVAPLLDDAADIDFDDATPPSGPLLLDDGPDAHEEELEVPTEGPLLD